MILDEHILVDKKKLQQQFNILFQLTPLTPSPSTCFLFILLNSIYSMITSVSLNMNSNKISSEFILKKSEKCFSGTTHGVLKNFTSAQLITFLIENG